MDFSSFGGRYYLIAADWASGYTMAAQTPDQIIESAIKFLKQMGNQFGYPHEVCTDNGPAFRHKFKTELACLGCEHHVSAPYVAAGNGLAECHVGIVKSYLSELGKLDNVKLSQLLYSGRGEMGS